MTDAPEPSKPNSQGSNFWIDFGPVAIFVAVYHYLRRSNPDEAIYTAAGIFMVVALLALGYSWVKHGKLSGMLLLTTVIIVITVILAWVFQNPVFFYMKPTVINILFGIGVIGGIFFKRNVLKLMMGEAFQLPDKAWDSLAIRWGLFFFAMAALNELVWRTQTEQFWVNFKLFGFLPLTILFTLSQIPFIMKHGNVRDQGDAG